MSSCSHHPSAKPILSIITPVLNAVDTLPTTLRSISQLKNTGIEHVIVDGGSADGTLDLIRCHCTSPPSTNVATRVVHDAAAGISAALNLGIEAARGTFIIATNADDTLCAPAVDALLTKLQECPDSRTVYYGNALQYDPATGNQFPRIATLAPIHNYMSLYHGALVVPSCVYQQVGVYDSNYKLAMDVEFVHRALAADITFEHVPATLTHMRLRGRSHVNTRAAMAEFERSTVYHQLQSPFQARLYRIRQTLFHELLKRSWFQAFWKHLKPTPTFSTDSPMDPEKK